MKSFRKRLAFGIAATAFWWLVVGPALGWVLFAIGRHLDAQMRFGAVPGVVLDTLVEVRPGRVGGFKPVVEYEYAAAGKTFRSRRIDFLEWTGDRAYADRIVGEFPAGKAIRVFCDPRRPERSVLRLAVPPPALALLLFLQPFLAIGVIFAVDTITLRRRLRRIRDFLARPPRLPWTIPSWGVLVGGPYGLAVRRRAAPLGPALAAYFAASFFSSAAIAVFFRAFSGSDVRVVGWGFAASAGAGLIAAAAGALRGRCLLRIDLAGERLVIPGGGGDREIPFREIVRWTVRRAEEKSAAPGKAFLVATTSGGGESVVHVFDGIERAWAVAEKVARTLGEGIGKLAEVDPARRAGRRGPPPGAGGRPG